MKNAVVLGEPENRMSKQESDPHKRRGGKRGIARGLRGNLFIFDEGVLSRNGPGKRKPGQYDAPTIRAKQF